MKEMTQKSITKNYIVRACRELTSQLHQHVDVSRRIIYASLVPVIFLLMFMFALSGHATVQAEDASTYECSKEILDHDTTQIDLVTEFGPSQITKGSEFTILIQNQYNDYSYTYYYEISQNNKALIKKNGLGGAPGLNNFVTAEVSTNDLDMGEYNLKVKVYHKDTGCLLALKNFSINIIKENSMALIDLKSFNNGEVTITALNKNVVAGNNFKATIENNGKNKLKYEMLVNDLKSGQFLRKSAGEVNVGSSVTAWATITSPGNHTVKVNILDLNGEILYTQDFPAIVTTSKAAQTKEEVAADPTKNSAETNSNGGTSNNKQPITKPINGKANPTLSTVFPELFEDPANADLDTVKSALEHAIQLALDFAGIVGFIMVLWASRMFLNSYGSPEAVASGKKTLIWALVGFSTIIISKAILNWFVWDLQQVGETFGK